MNYKLLLSVAAPFLKKAWKLLEKLWTPDPEKLYCVDKERYSYSTDDIERLREECVSIGASASPQFWSASNEDVRACFNGVGPGCWSTKALKTVNAILDECDAMAMVHDYEFTHSARNYIAFSLANLRLLVNGILEAGSKGEVKLVWFGIVLAAVSQVFGWPLYRDFDIAKYRERVKAAEEKQLKK